MPSPNREEGRVPSLSEGMGDLEAGGEAGVCSQLTAPTPAVHTSTRPRWSPWFPLHKQSVVSFPGRMAGACPHLCRECLGLSPGGPSGRGSLS